MATANQRIQNIRTTLDTLQAKANNNELLPGEIYVLTGAGSENKIAKAITSNSFEIIGGATGDSVNYGTISANKTLLPTDADYQIYTLNGNYNLYLPTSGVATNKKFIILVTNDTYFYLNVYNGGTLLDYVPTNDLKIYRYNGTTWYIEDAGNGIKNKRYSINTIIRGNNISANSYNTIAIGSNINSYYNSSIILGDNTSATGGYNVVLGYGSNSNSTGSIAIGSMNSAPGSYCVSIGYGNNANNKLYSSSLSSFTRVERTNEIVYTASQTQTNKAQLTDQKYTESTFTNSTDTWREMFIDGSSARLVLLNNSIYNFDLQINCIRIATSSDPVGKGKAWQIKGAIARSSLDGTRFLGIPIKTLLGQDPDGDLDLIDVQVIADTTNNTLGIQIKTGLGTGNNTYRFSANIRATETRS